VSSDGTGSIRRDSLRVTAMDRPGWCVGDGSTPQPGEAVFCVDGEAEVVRVLGRTGDGSRLLELMLPATPKASYFAASSNVLRKTEQVEDVTSFEETSAGPPGLIGNVTTLGFMRLSER